MGRLRDVITCAKFQIEIFMGYDFTGGQFFDFCIDFSMGLTTVQRYCAACDVVVGAFMKIFNTRSKEVATSCMEMFNFPLASVCISNRKSNFLRKLSISDNIICRLCAEYQA